MNRWAPFEWIAAIRFLKEGRMQTIFILSGIAIGVAVIVFMSALLTALQANITKRVLTSQPHIQIIPPDEIARPLRIAMPGTVYAPVIQRPAQRLRSIDQWQKITPELIARPDVTQVSPTVASAALAVRGDASKSITLTGIDPQVFFKIVKLPEYIVLGKPEITSEDIMIGTVLAKDLGVTLGDKLNITASNGVTQILKISAIFDLGNKGANEHDAYVAFRTGQTLAGLVGGVTTIDITVGDAFAAENIAQSISTEIGIPVDSWLKTNAQFAATINTQQIAFGIIRLFVGLSVAFGIASVLVVSVIQRSKDIGILRAMGTSQNQILRVFLLQGAVLGFGGSIVGAVLGAAAFVGFHFVSRQADGTDFVPLTISPNLFVYAIGLATLVGVGAAAVPALRAAKLDPVVAIRG